MNLDILLIILSCFLAAVAVMMWLSGRKNADFASVREAELKSGLAELQQKYSDAEVRLHEAGVEYAKIATRLNNLAEDLESEKKLNFNLQDEIKEHERTIQLKAITISGLENKLEVLQEKLDNQKQEIEEMQKQAHLTFESIAHKLLEENSQKFSQNSHEKMEQILTPLKENIQEFKKKVEDTYDKESKERHTLEAKIKELVELNNQISRDANNLTNALKGQAKTQGTWGEMILENILENSGLVRDREYFVQEVYYDEDGNKKQPDVIIKYPDQREIIIDSKVSLVAYERFVNEEDEKARELHLAAHFASIKMHIDGLSSKNYENRENSPAFVFLFVPIEPAFMTVMHYDRELWNYAYRKRIILISPTNLIAALKMIMEIWHKDRQNRNALEIAAQGSALYDKFVGFVNEMEKIGTNLSKTQESYDAAFKKLSTGNGNLITQVEKIKRLGLNTKKALHDKYLSDDSVGLE